jgi:GrpB-like predicted nucleotidyltransferase (UPF0157 family)
VLRRACEDVRGATVVVAYDDRWPEQFRAIRSVLEESLTRALRIEHVGSTAIPGMLAKPVIDIDVEIGDECDFDRTRDELQSIGYSHAGDQGITGREAFRRNLNCFFRYLDDIKHHLYVCATDCKEYQRHILFRDYLRTHGEARDRYNRIKTEILRRYGEDDRGKYVSVKEAEYRWFFDGVIKSAEQERDLDHGS